MVERKKVYKNGMKLFHNETKQKIMFGKWLEPDRASCLSLANNAMITLSREELDDHYTSYASLDRAYREKRRGEGW
ncbi:MAG: hypothetical protein AABZ14_07430 [Candidatus Margulisiibacteriota bacterium]